MAGRSSAARRRFAMYRLCQTLTLYAAALLSGSALTAYAAECPAIWSQDIAAVRSTLNQIGATEPMLVVREEDGAVFDCFNAVRSQRDLSQIDQMSRLIAAVEQKRPAVEKGQCGLSMQYHGSRKYIVLDLPSDLAVLASAGCRKSIARAATATRKSLGLDIPTEAIRSADPKALGPYLKSDRQ